MYYILEHEAQNHLKDNYNFKTMKYEFIHVFYLQLGIKKVFTAEADLSGLTSTHGDRLYVDKVVQKAFIDVNEAGTEAAAATAGKYLFCYMGLAEPNDINTCII